jgi:UDP-glucose 4-epimerase
MRVAVTGATGNVGTSVLRSLGSDETVDSIVGIARRQPAFTMPKTTWHAADVSSDDLTPLFREVDVVVHLAWAIQPSHDLQALTRTNVLGSQRVFQAAASAGVSGLVYASSVGAYSPGPKDRAVGEGWPTLGVPTSFYGRHKAQVEALLDTVERQHEEMRVVRLRPGLIFKRQAASQIRRSFAGPLAPTALLLRRRLPYFPHVPGLDFQAVHASDVAEAYRLAVTSSGAAGAFNIAAGPVLDTERLAQLLGARPVRIAPLAAQLLAGVTWRLRLQPTPPGWLDLALRVPVMDTQRARRELGWTPRYNAEEAFLELIAGLREAAGEPTPPLRPGHSGPDLAAELLSDGPMAPRRATPAER